MGNNTPSVVKWDGRFLSLAEHVAQWSKDPSTKVGAVIVRPDRTIASVGYNGFPRGVNDHPDLYADREQKYRRVVHAEINAAVSAATDIRGFTLYTWPFLPCERCAVQIIQYGISRVVAPRFDNPRWDFTLTRSLFAEANITCVEIDPAP